MAVTARQVRALAPTSTGTQDFTVSGFGTPQAAIFIFNSAASDSTPADDVRFSIGFWARYSSTDRQYVCHATYKDGQSDTPMYSHGGGDNDAVVRSFTLDSDSPTTAFNAEFNSVITNGVRINWTLADGSVNGYVTCVLFKDFDWAYVDYEEEDDLASYLDDLVFTGWPGEADVVFGLTHRDSSVGVGDTARISLGIAVNDGVESQGSNNFWMWADVKAGYTASIAALMSDDTLLVHTKGKATSPSWARRLVSFDANGATLEQIVTTGLEGRHAFVGILALKLPDGVQSSLDFLATPTSTGTWDITAPGFKPQFALVLSSNQSTYDALETSPLANVFAVSTIDENAQYANLCWLEDGTEPREAHTQSSAAALDQPTWGAGGGAGSDIVASFTSFDADGINLNVTSTDSTARKQIWFTLGTPLEETSGDNLDVTAEAQTGTNTVYVAGVNSDVDAEIAAGATTIYTAGSTSAVSVTSRDTPLMTSGDVAEATVTVGDGTEAVHVAGVMSDVTAAVGTGTTTIYTAGDLDDVVVAGPNATATTSGDVADVAAEIGDGISAVYTAGVLSDVDVESGDGTEAIGTAGVLSDVAVDVGTGTCAVYSAGVLSDVGVDIGDGTETLYNTGDVSDVNVESQDSPSWATSGDVISIDVDSGDGTEACYSAGTNTEIGGGTGTTRLVLIG